MTLFKLVSRTLMHYKGSSLASAAGIAVATAIICGALIIGDSLRESLLNVVNQRLGKVTHSITAGERLFTAGLADGINTVEGVAAVPVLKTAGAVAIQGTPVRVNNINIWGVDSLFGNLIGAGANSFIIPDGEAIIGINLAERLGVKEGDFLILRMNNRGPIPQNTPFVSEAGQTVSRRVKINRVITLPSTPGSASRQFKQPR